MSKEEGSARQNILKVESHRLYPIYKELGIELVNIRSADPLDLRIGEIETSRSILAKIIGAETGIPDHRGEDKIWEKFEQVADRLGQIGVYSQTEEYETLIADVLRMASLVEMNDNHRN